MQGVWYMYPWPLNPAFLMLFSVFVLNSSPVTWWISNNCFITIELFYRNCSKYRGAIGLHLYEWQGGSQCYNDDGHTTVFFSCDQAALRTLQSVRPSIRLWHIFHNVPVIVTSWNFQELLPLTKVMSMQKVKVRGQWSRSQRSKRNLAVSRL